MKFGGSIIEFLGWFSFACFVWFNNGQAIAEVMRKRVAVDCQTEPGFCKIGSRDLAALMQAAEELFAENAKLKGGCAPQGERSV